MNGTHKDPLLPLIVPAEHGRIDPVPLLASLFAHAPLAVAVLEGGTLVHRWSNARWSERLPGQLRPADLVGTSLASVLAEGEGELLAVARRALHSGLPQPFAELYVHGAQGEAWLSGVAQPFQGRVEIGRASCRERVL